MGKSQKRPFGEFGSPTWGVGRSKHLLIPLDELLAKSPPEPEPLPPTESECQECGGQHKSIPLGIPNYIVCPRLPAVEVQVRAMLRIESRLDQAAGQTPRVEASMHRAIAEDVLNWAGYHAWGIDPDPRFKLVLAVYGRREPLGPLLRDLQKAWQLLAEEEGVPSLNDRQKSYIVDYDPLVQATAAKLLRDDRGRINQFQFAALVDLGQSILIQQVRRYDPSSGFTFGAFVRKRLKGAMADWLLENNHLYLDDDGGWEQAQKYATESAMLDAKFRRPRGRPRGSGRKDAQAAPQKKAAHKSGAVRGVEALERNLEVLSRYTPAEIEAALAEIRGRPKVGVSAERVFRGRFLTDPPVTISALVGELGLDRGGVSRKAQNTFNYVIDLIEAARKG